MEKSNHHKIYKKIDFEKSNFSQIKMLLGDNIKNEKMALEANFEMAAMVLEDIIGGGGHCYKQILGVWRRGLLVRAF